MELLQFLLVGFVAGWVLGRIRRGKGYGVIGNILIGGAGSLVGGFIFGFLRLPTPNMATRMVMAVVGAIVLFVLLGLLRWSKRKAVSKEENT